LDLQLKLHETTVILPTLSILVPATQQDVPHANLA